MRHDHVAPALDARPARRRRSAVPDGTAAPFIKWAGGKTQLLGPILAALPARIDVYYEPFIGGGAAFFALAAQGRFARAVLADRNPDLVEAYRVVRDDVDGLVGDLRVHQEHARDPDYYYGVRARDPSGLGPVARAARLIYLNRTCYNGLYRVNRRGEFNAPFGRYANPTVCNEPLLRAASRALAPAELVVGDFADTVAAAGPGDAVYFDPPYVPISATSSFTAYDASPFREEEHRRLAGVYRACLARGAAAVLSNSDCALTRALYDGLDVQTVLATRAVNSVAARRGKISEILVSGR